MVILSMIFGTFIRITFTDTIEGVFLKSVIVVLLTYSWTNVIIMLNVSCSHLRDWYSSAKQSLQFHGALCQQEAGYDCFADIPRSISKGSELYLQVPGCPRPKNSDRIPRL